ncbi:MAG: tRNA (N6-threonylcarbamoyladenosine(37)-N6)-methyltransferase TrmO [Bacteroidia bacterium]
MEIKIEPIAIVKNQRTDLSDDYWGTIITEIELLPNIPTESLNGIETFSHLEIIYQFNKVDENKIVFSGHPRGNKDWPNVGIFAQRKKDRPNRIGLTIAELIERKDRILIVKNLDAINGTPIIDIKPVMKEFLPKTEIKQPAWASELMKDYWK